MVKFSEVIEAFLLGIAWATLSIMLIALTDYQILIIPVFLIFVIISIILKRRKKILPYVREDFKKSGFDLLDERPLRLSDQKITFGLNITLNDVPISRYGYFRQFFRIFKARGTDGRLYAIKAEITQLWNGKIATEILSTKAYVKNKE